jgi:hypothetical protein
MPMDLPNKRPSSKVTAVLLGVLVGLAFGSAIAFQGEPATAATIQNVQGVAVELCDEGEAIYGTQRSFLYNQDETPVFDPADTPEALVTNRAVTIDGDKPVERMTPWGVTDNAVRIEGTNSYFIPKSDNPSRADVIFVIEEIAGGYMVTSIMACL